MKVSSGVTYALMAMLFSFPALSQPADTAMGKIVYQEQLAYSGDSNTTGLTYFTKTMFLYIGRSTAIYQSGISDYKASEKVFYQGIDSNQVDKNAVAKQVEERLAGVALPATGTQFLKNYNSDLLTIHQTAFGEEFLISDTLAPIKWNITAETKNIASFECRKATGIFRGRNYTAWFTTDIPVSAGPWKLGGLPGLILQAEDDKHQVAFTAVKISLPSPEKLLLANHFTGKKVSREQFRKFTAQKQEDRQKMAAANTMPGVRLNVSTRKIVALELDLAL
ncbi:GLPGLI family protein [Pseudoflavitalea sp. X16]|uniref:GLPGLI family protein n=1 Tax=Paraflavitalea devenefica TaxID=2716334 RepID=UPI00141EBDA2|nr:GLPGLI family protein [Paraflavitalea devenefica]NII28828.1 GLPGLI family protein [Paraflavitalea devenefica]